MKTPPNRCAFNIRLEPKCRRNLAELLDALTWGSRCKVPTQARVCSCVRGAWRPPGEGDRAKQTTAVQNPVAYRSASIVHKGESQSAEMRAAERTGVFVVSPKWLLTVCMTQRQQSSLWVCKIEVNLIYMFQLFLSHLSLSLLFTCSNFPLTSLSHISLSLSHSQLFAAVGLSLSPRRILMKYLLKNRNTVAHNWHQLTQYLSYQT